MTNPTGWPDASKPGYPINPEQDGTHWLVGWNGKLFAAEWYSCAPLEEWLWPGGDDSPDGVVKIGWGYAGPCLTPAEVEAKVAAARREAIEATAKVVVPFALRHEEILLNLGIRPTIGGAAGSVEHAILAMLEETSHD